MNLVFGHLKICLGKLEDLSAFDLFRNARKIFPALGATVDSMRDNDVWKGNGRKTMAGVSLRSFSRSSSEDFFSEVF